MPIDLVDFTLCLPFWNAKAPSAIAFRNDPRMHIIVKMITVQLLASCFTPPRDMNTLNLPSGWYHANDVCAKNGLVSSLRQHTQWRHSPAYGHHARNNSAVSLWPGKDLTLSREDRLAEQISHKRLIGRKKRKEMLEDLDPRLRDQSEHFGEDKKQHRYLPVRHRRRSKRIERASPIRNFQSGRYGLSPVSLNSDDNIRQTKILRVIRGLPQRMTSDDCHSWSLEPILRSERHPIFIQPVKEHVMKKWKAFRSSTHTRSYPSTSASYESQGTRPQFRRSISSTSRDSIQLNRRTQIMTMIQGSGSSFHLLSHGPNDEASSAMPTETILGAAMKEEPVNNREEIFQESPAGEVLLASFRQRSPIGSRSTDDCGQKSTFCATDQKPRGTVDPLDLAQTRNRTSTSGTTV